MIENKEVANALKGYSDRYKKGRNNSLKKSL